MRINRNIADVLFWLGLGFIAFGLSEAKSAEPREHTISWPALDEHILESKLQKGKKDEH